MECNEIEVLIATTLADDFQYSIGDARLRVAYAHVALGSDSFNTPLEMPEVAYELLSGHADLRHFQYSIGDARQRGEVGA